jgi:hypothetical protein
MADSIMDAMRATPIWLVWKAIVEPGKSKPRKVPYYVNGAPRSGTLDSPEDRAQLVTYDHAVAALEQSGAYAGLAIALGPDGRGGHWQGIDLDDMVAKGVTDIADMWTRGSCAGLGYIELSPSGNGIHLIGYGRPFQSLGSNSSGIEAYAGGRFFTFTEQPIVADSPCGTYDLADYVEQALSPRHSAGRAAAAGTDEAAAEHVDAKTVTELRSALLSMQAEDRVLWVAVGHALKKLGGTGRALFMEWSATSLTNFDPTDAAAKWATFNPQHTAYQAVFKMAQERGWVNPASNAARPDPVTIDLSTPPTITLEFAMASDTATIKLEYLLDPYLPAKCVVGGYGRGSTAKSSLYASAAAYISPYASTLWVSVEEPADWIKTRHITCGGQEQTLAVVKAVASKKDTQGRVIASSFNVYDHLEPAIASASAGFAEAGKPPLRLVVLDTAVGLTGWGRGETPNDDASVKKLLGFLQALAERHNLTIVAIGHANKGKHEHFADTVMGASAWTNSPRLSFVHAADVREDYAYVMRVAKTNFDTFGVPYKTQPVHTLYERANGPDTVLVRAVPGDVVWGESASMEMFMQATRKPQEDGEGGGGGGNSGSRGGLRLAIVQALVELVIEAGPDVQVTREQVEERYGKTVDRKQWTKVDEYVFDHPSVIVERGDKNRVLYRARPKPVVH